ncbi:MAG: hypothetical protein EOO09_00180 [Chitinophagaceae bacterium]|nr:MAG: hypothetical protein EOO09_00180 [Chitinophagaceae bacterium]
MKLSTPFLLLIAFLSCNNDVAKPDAAFPDVSQAGKAKTAKASATGDCGSTLIFKKGAKFTNKAVDANGKLIVSTESEVIRVSDAGGGKQSEIAMTSTFGDGREPTAGTGRYACDGTNLLIDLSSFVTTSENTKISSAGFSFSSKLEVGQSLPDANYTVSMNYGGKEMQIATRIHERKVEAKEKLTTAAGSFDCYRIVPTIETSSSMAGLTPEVKEELEKAKKRMGKNTMTVWYAPSLTILAMELFISGKVAMRNEITSISK